MGDDRTAAPDDAMALEILTELDAPGVAANTPEAFLAGVSVALKASDDVDADLATILSNHLLTIRPHANVVANAKAAIVALAVKRAAPIGEQVGG